MKRVPVVIHLALLSSLCSVSWLQAQPQFVLSWTHNFNECRGIAVDPSGNVYVVDTGNDRIQKFDGNGQFILMWGSSGSLPGQFHGAFDVAVDAQGSVYVVEANPNQRVQKFDGSGRFILTWGSPGSGDGQFTTPEGIAVDPPTGDVYVADTFGNRIQRFTATGQFIRKWGGIQWPEGIAVDVNGRVYVTDGLGNIRKFDGYGRLLSTWSPVTTPYSNPFGIAADSAGSIFVTESQAGLGPARVEMFSNTGAFVLSWGEDRLHDPRNIAVSGHGIYVSDTGGAIFKYSYIPVGIQPETWSGVKSLYQR